jgi:hypothetical protein
MALITYTGTSTNATSAASTLKPIYEKAAQEQFSRATLAYKLAMKNKKKFVGTNYYFAANPMPGGNFVVTSETSEFAAPYHRDVVQGYVSIRGYHGVTISITKAQMERSKDPEAAFINNFSQQVKDAAWMLSRHINREFYGDGKAKLATIKSDAAGTMTIDTTAYPYTTRHIGVGDNVSFFAAGNTARGSATYVTAITDDSTFVVASDPSAIDTDYVTITGNFTAGGSDGTEMQGLGSICSTSSTYKQISPTSYGFWKAVVNSNSGTARDLDLSLVQNTVLATQLNTGADSDTALCSPEMIYPLFQLMSGNIRYTASEAGMSGFKNPEIMLPSANGAGAYTMKFLSDRYCPPGRFYIFPSGELEMLVQLEPQFLDETGNPVQRIPRTQIFEGQYVFAGEPFTRRRNAFAMLSDINYTAVNSVSNY